jgi:hypothetical protein
MIDDFNRLEAELAGLTPREPSPQLAHRVAEELTQDSVPHPIGSRRIPWLRGMAACGLIAAASSAIWYWSHAGDDANVPAPGNSTQPLLSAAFDPALPSVWSFRGASAESPADLNALLDQHAGRAPALRPELVQTRGFGVSETQIHQLFGEL